jgi:hypothetical protein
VTDPQAVHLGQQGRRERPALERGRVGQMRAVEMVVEPERVEAEPFRVPCPLQHLVVAERELGHVDPDADRLAHVANHRFVGFVVSGDALGPYRWHAEVVTTL